MDISKERLEKESERQQRAEAASFKHQKSQPSAAFPADMDAEQDPVPGLKLLDTQDLRDRAASLVIDGWPKMSRNELIAALATYRRQDPVRNPRH